MSKQVAVYGVSGTPEGYRIKNSEAKRLVRQMFAVWLERNVSIQRLSIREFRPSSAPQPRPVPSLYIPDHMPPAEVPGVRFVLPVTVPSWYPPVDLGLSIAFSG